MPGEWIFNFNWDLRQHLDLAKYQELLVKIHEEFAPQFASMNSSVGTGMWNAGTGSDGKPVAPAGTNVFAEFSYKCTRPHVAGASNPDHGKWTLLWDPTLTDMDNPPIHARCAPMPFKQLSNQIQEKLVAAFPAHFIVLWKNGMSGYQNAAKAFNMDMVLKSMDALEEIKGADDSDESSEEEDWETDSDDSDEEDGISKLVRQTLVYAKWSEDDRCLHHLPWGYCEECTSDVLEMHDEGLM